MSQVHGRAVTSEEIERAFGRDVSPARFPSMCNAICWASAKKNATSVPSFTERVYVRDDGVDAEWEVELPKDYNFPLLGPGWNVFQYKQRELAARGRERAFSGIESDLRKALKEVHERTGRRPDNYVVFLNLDLTHRQKDELAEKIFEGYDRRNDARVEIVGAAELAAFLTDVPHLRFAYFGTPYFFTVEEQWESHLKAKPFGASVSLVGRDEEMGELNAFLENPDARAMLISGPQDVGKSRLALEATRSSRPLETVVVLDPKSLAATDLLTLRPAGSEVVLVIEDPDPTKAEELVHQALAGPGLKLLITFSTAEHAPTPGYGQDDRVQALRLGPLSDQQASDLLRAARLEAGRLDLDYGIESWIIEHASGNPGILLVAASVGPELIRTTAGSFAEEVGRGFERKVRRRLGEATVKTLEPLSLLTQIGVARVAAEELEGVLESFGDGLTTNDVLRSIPRLEQAGLVRRRGSYVEVTPAIFANNLATTALRGRTAELYSLLFALSQPAKFRLLRRLQALSSEDVTRFWKELFDLGGPLEDLPAALLSSHLLRSVAGAAPDKTTQLIQDGLAKMGLKERLEIGGGARRDLVEALQKLLFRRRTSESALHCLALLAEAETENYANNATGVFCECFRPWHPQFPMPLPSRLRFLQEILQGDDAVDMRLIALKAIEAGLALGGIVLPHQGGGPEPLALGPLLTYGEMWDYFENLVALLMEAARSEQPKVATAAGAALPGVISDYALQLSPEAAVARIEVVVEWTLNHEAPVPVSGLADQLCHVRAVLEGQVGTFEPEASAKVQCCIEKLEELIVRLDGGDFATRLKRWAGRSIAGDWKYEVDDSGERAPRFVRELRTLAREATYTQES